VKASDVPYGTTHIPGIAHRRSTLSVDETVDRLSELIEAAGATIFTVIDQRRAAEAAGLRLRDTKLMVFGNPAAGTPLMAAVPLSAMDLPLKILVWQDDEDQVWMTYLSAEWLADRYGLTPQQAQPLAAAEAMTGRVATSG
jgi:uncharacterized protein (DUF302 family)